MKTPNLILLFFLFSIITNIVAENPNDTTYVKTEHYEGIIFGKNYPKNRIYKGNIDEMRWNPTIEDIAAAEKILEKYLNRYCRKYSKKDNHGTSFVCKNLDDYIRQYLGEFNNEQKILFIYCFWKGILQEHLDWKINMIKIFDGGSDYWYMKIDMDKRKVVDFYIHGSA